jgi:hypothetical protein
MTCCSIALREAFCIRLRNAVCCTPAGCPEGGANLEIPEMADMMALWMSEPTGRFGSALLSMFNASPTEDNASALAPGEPPGTEIGDDPIGGVPVSEGGIIAMFTSDDVCADDSES